MIKRINQFINKYLNNFQSNAFIVGNVFEITKLILMRKTKRAIILHYKICIFDLHSFALCRNEGLFP